MASENNNTADSSTATGILRVGEVIRPPVALESAKKLAEKLYGLQVTEIREMVSYDDKNFHIKAKEARNPNVKNISEYGYTLKITNSLDSQIPGLIESQTKALLHIHRKGTVPVPLPIPNINGQLVPLECLYSDQSDNGTEQSTTNEAITNKYAVRLFTFLPGVPARGGTKTPLSQKFFFQWGQTLASLHNALQDFRSEPLENRQTIWSMLSIPRLSEFFFAVKDVQRRRLAEDIVQIYNELVMPKIPTLPSGIIHGDLNELNMLIRPMAQTDKETDENYGCSEICGVLDFGDMHKAPYVCDLAIAIAYAILECGRTASLESPILAGGHLLAGYQSVRPDVSSLEFQLIPIIASARLCQSLVMGDYTHLQDPSNTYILETSRNGGWTILQSLQSMSVEDVCNIWKNIINQSCSY